ncbi:unnamed protein product [Penicillium glandicola]
MIRLRSIPAHGATTSTSKCFSNSWPTGWEEYENVNEKQKKENLRATPDKKSLITAWLLSRCRPQERSLGQITHDLIVATFESTPSTAGTMLFILANLMSRPELVNELRDEVDEVLSNGLLSRP